MTRSQHRRAGPPLALAATVLLVAAAMVHATDVGGTITNGAVWTATGAPYEPLAKLPASESAPA